MDWLYTGPLNKKLYYRHSLVHGEGFGQVILTDTHSDRIMQAFGEGAEVEFIYL